MKISDTFRLFATSRDWRQLFERTTLKAARTMLYHQYLHSRAWAGKCAEVRERSGGCCERCGCPGSQNVHHRTYARLGAELLEDLADLCRHCHQIVHGLRRSEGDEDGDLPPVVADAVTALACRGSMGSELQHPGGAA